MRVRHSETRARFAEPSVTFYRTIALSFVVVTVILFGVIIFITSKKVTVTVLAKEDLRNINFTVPVSSKPDKDGVLVGEVNSSVVNFSEKYYPTSAKTIDGIAMGEVTIYNTTRESQVLVRTTRLLTPNDIMFRLSDKVTVPAGGSVKAEVYADKSGSSGNIGPSKFTIPGLAVEKQKYIYAESSAPMANGSRKVGVLTDEDMSTAKKDYEEKLKQKYQTMYTREGVRNAVSVSNVNPVASRKLGEEIDSFTLSGTSTVIVVSYDMQDLEDLINDSMSGKIDSSLEKILTTTNQTRVSVSSFESLTNSAKLSVTQDVYVTLDSNSEKLSPQNFMGKKKDEIERYVFELDHVAGVEVKFSPSWISTAPAVPDKIKVIVKSVK